jgi:hypothetical protein
MPKCCSIISHTILINQFYHLLTILCAYIHRTPMHPSTTHHFQGELKVLTLTELQIVVMPENLISKVLHCIIVISNSTVLNHCHGVPVRFRKFNRARGQISVTIEIPVATVGTNMHFMFLKTSTTSYKILFSQHMHADFIQQRNQSCFTRIG